MLYVYEYFDQIFMTKQRYLNIQNTICKKFDKKYFDQEPKNRKQEICEKYF